MSTDTLATPPPQAQLFDMVMGLFRSRVLQVFAELRVADAIAAGRAPEVNDRFLRAAASLGLLTMDPLTLTPLGTLLRSDVPGSLRGFITAVSGGAHYEAWKHLAYAARTEGCAFDHAFGEDVWAYFTKTNPAEGKVFNEAMTGMSMAIIEGVLAAYDFPQTGHMVDIAGGNGALLCAILQARPAMTGTVLDLAFTIPVTIETIGANGLAGRCQAIAGDIFQSIPAGADLYSMKWILHDWNDEKCGVILRNIHAAMPAHAKLLILDAVVPEGDAAGPARMMDINMMVMTGGKERTLAEWNSLLVPNGFRVERVYPMPAPVAIIEVIKL